MSLTEVDIERIFGNKLIEKKRKEVVNVREFTDESGDRFKMIYSVYVDDLDIGKTILSIHNEDRNEMVTLNLDDLRSFRKLLAELELGKSI